MTGLDVRWLSVFADVPATRFSAARTFWESATDTTAGDAAGERREFTPLEPRDGSRYLWMQRISRGTGGWHPDLHVLDPMRAAAQAVALGAQQKSATDDLVVLTTPAGQPFCVVEEDGDQRRRRPRPSAWGGRRSVADQLCLDIPADRFDADVEFWTRLTGWPRGVTDSPEFERLNPPGRLPVQFLLQRLGTDDTAGPRAHLDLSSDNSSAESERHKGLGASEIRSTEGWTTLRDPAGLVYCVTRRTPGEPPR